MLANLVGFDFLIVKYSLENVYLCVDYVFPDEFQTKLKYNSQIKKCRYNVDNIYILVFDNVDIIYILDIRM